MNIANAYPAEAGAKSWRRVVNMDKNKGIITVEDTYSAVTRLASLTQSLMTVCPADITNPGTIIFSLPGSSKVYMNYDKNLWVVSEEKMNLVTREDRGLQHSWDGRDIWRILLTSKSNKLKNSISYDIHK